MRGFTKFFFKQIPKVSVDIKTKKLCLPTQFSVKVLVTGSSDKTMKVWDISKSKPTCISETEAKIGMVHALDGCPDAPFVFAFGGDTPSHNMHVMDVRESAKGKINNVKVS